LPEVECETEVEGQVGDGGKRRIRGQFWTPLADQILVPMNIPIDRRNEMQSVAESKCGQKGVIAMLDGNFHFLTRITAIGLTPGCPVEVLRSEKRQPVLLYSRDTMIAIGRREGEKIMLEVNK
jgi:ferrous iron transport protein A